MGDVIYCCRRPVREAGIDDRSAEKYKRNQGAAQQRPLGERVKAKLHDQAVAQQAVDRSRRSYHRVVRTAKDGRQGRKQAAQNEDRTEPPATYRFFPNEANEQKKRAVSVEVKRVGVKKQSRNQSVVLATPDIVDVERARSDRRSNRCILRQKNRCQVVQDEEDRRQKQRKYGKPHRMRALNRIVPIPI